MRWLLSCLSGFLGFLCRIFGVTPERAEEEREKHPSPSREN
jgi:hypothetical protein